MAQNSNQSIDDSFPELLETETLGGIAHRNHELAAFSEDIGKGLNNRIISYLKTNHGITSLVESARVLAFSGLANWMGYSIDNGNALSNIEKIPLLYLGATTCIDLLILYYYRMKNAGRSEKSHPIIIFEKLLFDIGKRIFYDGPKGFIDRHNGKNGDTAKAEPPYLELKAADCNLKSLN